LVRGDGEGDLAGRLRGAGAGDRQGGLVVVLDGAGGRAAADHHPGAVAGPVEARVAEGGGERLVVLHQAVVGDRDGGRGRGLAGQDGDHLVAQGRVVGARRGRAVAGADQHGHV